MQGKLWHFNICFATIASDVSLVTLFVMQRFIPYAKTLATALRTTNFDVLYNQTESHIWTQLRTGRLTSRTHLLKHKTLTTQDAAAITTTTCLQSQLQTNDAIKIGSLT